MWMRNHRRQMKIESWECPIKGCEYIFAQGLGVAPPEGLIYDIKDAQMRRKPRPASKLLCPKHQVGLTKNSTKVKITEWKGVGPKP